MTWITSLPGTIGAYLNIKQAKRGFKQSPTEPVPVLPPQKQPEVSHKPENAPESTFVAVREDESNPMSPIDIFVREEIQKADDNLFSGFGGGTGGGGVATETW